MLRHRHRPREPKGCSEQVDRTGGTCGPPPRTSAASPKAVRNRSTGTAGRANGPSSQTSEPDVRRVSEIAVRPRPTPSPSNHKFGIRPTRLKDTTAATTHSQPVQPQIRHPANTPKTPPRPRPTPSPSNHKFGIRPTRLKDTTAATTHSQPVQPQIRHPANTPQRHHRGHDPLPAPRGRGPMQAMAGNDTGHGWTPVDQVAIVWRPPISWSTFPALPLSERRRP